MINAEKDIAGVQRFLKALEIRDVNKGITSTDFNEGIDGGGHGLIKKEKKWHSVIDFILARLGVTTTILKLKERAASEADVAGYGQLWIKNTAPCELWFTDDAGTDTQIV